MLPPPLLPPPKPWMPPPLPSTPPPAAPPLPPPNQVIYSIGEIFRAGLICAFAIAALVCLAALHVVIMGTSRDTEGNYGLLVNEDSDGYGDTKPSAAALAGYEAGLQAARQAAAASKGLDSAKKKPDAVIDVGTIAPHQLASPTPSTRSDTSHRSDRSGRSALGSRSRATPTLPSVSLYSPRIERLRHRIHQGYVLTAQEMAELEAEDAKALKDKGKRGEEWSA